MNRNNHLKILFAIVSIFVLAVWMTPATSESACGAAASSCKNCHEVKGEMRVGDKGDYHSQHAFGDFCVFCHSGNTAATSKAEAHEGMVKPLENLEQSCASCHPDDFEGRGKGYGAVIKPKGGDDGGKPAATGSDSTLEAGKSGSAGTTIAAVSEKPAARKEESYVILAPTPDPSAVPPEDLIDYNVLYSARMEWGMPGTMGDWILVAMSLFMMMGFPVLYWLFGKKKQTESMQRVTIKKDVNPLQKDAMDEGMA
jgi:hypothetical protein